MGWAADPAASHVPGMGFGIGPVRCGCPHRHRSSVGHAVTERAIEEIDQFITYRDDTASSRRPGWPTRSNVRGRDPGRHGSSNLATACRDAKQDRRSCHSHPATSTEPAISLGRTVAPTANTIPPLSDGLRSAPVSHRPPTALLAGLHWPSPLVRRFPAFVAATRRRDGRGRGSYWCADLGRRGHGRGQSRLSRWIPRPSPAIRVSVSPPHRPGPLQPAPGQGIHRPRS